MNRSLDAQDFAREVALVMLRMRGWRDPKHVPAEVRNDVFNVMANDPHYPSCFAQGTSPEQAGTMIQNRVWDGVTPQEQT